MPDNKICKASNTKPKSGFISTETMIDVKLKRKRRNKQRDKCRRFDRSSKTIQNNEREEYIPEGKMMPVIEDLVNLSAIEKYHTCNHGKIPQQCKQCQSLTFMLCRKRLVKNNKKLKQILVKDVCKIICSFLTYSDEAYVCHRCLGDDEGFERDEFYVDYGTGIYMKRDNVMIAGGYSSVTGGVGAHFVCAKSQYLTYPKFRERYLTKKQKDVRLRDIKTCDHCIREMFNNGEIMKKYPNKIWVDSWNLHSDL